MAVKASKAAESRAVSASEAARLLGRDRGTLARWIADGCPTVGAARRGEGVEWKVDLGALLTWRIAREREAERARVEARMQPELDRAVRALEQAGESAGEHVDWQEARRRRTLAEARLRELELAEREGRLLDFDAVTIQWSAITTGIRARVLATPGKLALLLASEMTPAGCHQLVEQELHAALEAIADVHVDDPPPRGLLVRLVMGDVEVTARPIGGRDARPR